MAIDQRSSVHTSALEHRSLMCAWETAQVTDVCMGNSTGHQTGFIVKIN